MRVKWYASDSHACGHVRGEIIARAINKLYAPHTMDFKLHCTLSDFYAAEVMVFQRQHDANMLEKLRLAKEMGIFTVYEIDDDFFATPKEFEGPWQYYAQPEIQKLIKLFLQEADAISVSTPELKASMQRYTTQPITVVENALDVDFWEQVQKPVNEDPIIGWMASGSHMIDSPLVTEPLLQILREREKVKLFTIGLMGTTELPGIEEFRDRVMIMSWQDSSVLPDRMRHMDIGLAPLIRHPYNDCKSHVKALQYWAHKTPVICSPCPAYERVVQDGVNGIVADTKEDWYNALVRLLDDKEKRQELGENGHKVLCNEHDIRDNAKNWIELFAKMI